MSAATQNVHRSLYGRPVTVPYQTFMKGTEAPKADASVSRSLYMQVETVGLEGKYRRVVMDFGKTKLMAVVKGPFKRSAKRRSKLRCFLTYPKWASPWHSRAALAAQRRSEIMEKTRTALSAAIVKSRYRGGFCFDLHFLILEDDGCLLSCAITLGSAALAYAGVKMYGLVYSRTLLKGLDGVSVVDPSLVQEAAVGASSNTAVLTVAYIPALDSVVLMDQQGYQQCVQVSGLGDWISEATDATRELVPFVQDVLIADYRKYTGMATDTLDGRTMRLLSVATSRPQSSPKEETLSGASTTG